MHILLYHAIFHILFDIRKTSYASSSFEKNYLWLYKLTLRGRGKRGCYICLGRCDVVSLWDIGSYAECSGNPRAEVRKLRARDTALEMIWCE